MKIKLTNAYVDDQDKALRFYTDALGFAKKTDFSQGPYRWLTVASREEPDGNELQLALNNNHAAKALVGRRSTVWQPVGWLSCAGSGPHTWMLSNATSTAWINQHQRNGRRGEEDD